MKKIINNMNNKEKTLLFILFSLLFSMFNYNYFIENKRITYNYLKDEIISFENRVKDINDFKTGKYDINYREIGKFDYKNINLEKIFKIIHLSENEFFEIIDLEIIDVGFSDEFENIKESNLNIKAIGNLQELINFTDEFEKTLSFINIENISITNSKDKSELNMNVSMYEIDYDFSYSDSEKVEINKDPLGEKISRIEINSEYKKEDLDKINLIDKDNIKLENHNKKTNKIDKEIINFEYIELDDNIDYSSLIKFIRSDNKNIDVKLFNRLLLGESFLELSYEIKERNKSNQINLILNEKDININKNSQVNIQSKEKNEISIHFILSDGLEIKEYMTEMRLNENWNSFEFELEKENFYLTEIGFDLKKSKDFGVINVQIK